MTAGYCLEKLKKDYEKLAQKHKLPSFSELNEEFDIEKIAEHETELLLREIRKAITEKSVAFLRFIETLLNPSAAPLFMMTILKNFSQADRKLAEKIYDKICEFEISAIALDLRYNEKKEAEFIKNAIKKWNEISSDVEQLSDAINKAWNTATVKGKERKEYLG